MIATVLLSLAILAANAACSPDPSATRDSREADAVEMNLQAKKTGVNMTFDSGGTEARTLVIHSLDEQQLSEAARCQIAQEGFLLIVNVYGKSGSDYRLWELGR